MDRCFSLSEPIFAEDDTTFSLQDLEKEEVVSRKIIRDRECFGSLSTTSVSMKTDNNDVELRPQVIARIHL